jgi:phosphoenolpyruvate-protein phosphotransferase
MAKEIALLVKQHVARELVNVEDALDSVICHFVERFQGLESAYIREREQDVRDVGQRMMRHLADSPTWTNQLLPAGSIIVARELLPSEAVELAKSGLAGIVSEHGGKFSHTAIVARSLGIPAVTGISNATSQIQSGIRLLVDGEAGNVLMAPSASDEAGFARRKREHEARADAIAIKEELPCITLDGIEISLLANVGRPEEIEQVTEHHLTGVGLFRTEFLYLEAHERPNSQVQLEMYDRMARDLNGLPLIIRTFDLGGDKLPPFLLLEGPQKQTSLHLRGLRFSLAERNLLDMQLRAIVQVAQTSDIRILFPMVIGSDDFSQAIAAVESVADQLGVLRRPPIGAMIETPAALYALDEILELAEFVSLGTNDLTQYMLAVDRDLAEGTDDCTAMHPAVLRAIKEVVEAAEKRECPICVCGEEAADSDFACLLVGLGIRELSMTPARAARVRHSLRKIGCDKASEVANSALQCQTAQQVRELLQQLQPIEVRSNPS